MTAAYAGSVVFAPSTSAGEPHVVVPPSMVVPASAAPTAAQVSGRCTRPSTGILVWRVVDAEGDPVTFRLTSTSNPALVARRDVSVTTGGPTGALRLVSITADSGSGTARLTFAVSDGTSTVTEVVQVRVGGVGPDSLTARPVSTLLLGRGGADRLSGGRASDTICGGGGDDVLLGGADNDFLFGKDGRDVLTGNSGADHFSGGPGADQITDFTPAQGDKKRHDPRTS